jgi:hypothetical protein
VLPRLRRELDGPPLRCQVLGPTRNAQVRCDHRDQLRPNPSPAPTPIFSLCPPRTDAFASGASSGPTPGRNPPEREPGRRAERGPRATRARHASAASFVLPPEGAASEGPTFLFVTIQHLNAAPTGDVDPSRPFGRENKARCARVTCSRCSRAALRAQLRQGARGSAHVNGAHSPGGPVASASMSTVGSSSSRASSSACVYRRRSGALRARAREASATAAGVGALNCGRSSAGGPMPITAATAGGASTCTARARSRDRSERARRLTPRVVGRMRFSVVPNVERHLAPAGRFPGPIRECSR